MRAGLPKPTTTGIGKSHPRAKLTEHEVRLVLALLAEGMSPRKVAAKMGVSRSRASLILRRKRRAELAAEDSKLIRRVWREGFGWRVL